MSFSKILIVLIVFSISNTSFSNSRSTKNDGKKEVTLKSVMRELSEAMAGIGKGIYYEDFKQIESSAKRIANHPEPKGQLPKVIWALKLRMLDFKKLDSVVHNSAKDIEVLALKKDMGAILKKHSVLVNGCVACHDKYRDEISQLFK